MGSSWARDSLVGSRIIRICVAGRFCCVYKGRAAVGKDTTRIWRLLAGGLTVTLDPQGMAALMMTVIEPDTGRIGC